MVEGEAVVACSDKSRKIGVAMWDLESGENLLHIPSSASPPFGLLCIRNRFLVASQTNKHGSVGDGAIVVWAFNKPQQPLLNYPVEAIGPLSCTNDGIYLVGGALSGNAYIWDVTSGKLLKAWAAHNKSLNCMIFSDDNSFLISSSDDGTICVWSMISLLDVEEAENSPSSLHCLSAHMSSITGLLSSLSILVSSSLDGTCKVWDFISGRHIQTQVYPEAITSISLHQRDRLLFYGTESGTIIVNRLDVGMKEGPSIVAVGQPHELKGHNGAITAMTSSRGGLISASEDGMICIWDIITLEIIRSFNLQKAVRVTNLVVVSRSSLLSTSNHQRFSNEYTISQLNKHPQMINSFQGTTNLITLRQVYTENQTGVELRSTGLLGDKITGAELRSSDLLGHKISSSQSAVDIPMGLTIQMKGEKNIESRMWATNMAKHIMVINRNLQSHLLELIQSRLFSPNNTNLRKASNKKLKIQSPSHEEDNQKS